jgi:hypothetical protein
MKRFLSVLATCLVLAGIGGAQQAASNIPAAKEDVERVFEVMHLRDTMKLMMDGIAKQQRQLMHEQLRKNAANLPPDFETRMDKMLEDTLKDFPMEEMFQVMIPVYQKHLNKGDLDAMVAFYSTPTGQKLMKELPAITQEAMQAAYPLMQKQTTLMMERVQREMAQATKEPKPKSGQNSQTTPN